jgi:hypothetical protein
MHSGVGFDPHSWTSHDWERSLSATGAAQLPRLHSGNEWPAARISFHEAPVAEGRGDPEGWQLSEELSPLIAAKYPDFVVIFGWFDPTWDEGKGTGCQDGPGSRLGAGCVEAAENTRP